MRSLRKVGHFLGADNPLVEAGRAKRATAKRPTRPLPKMRTGWRTSTSSPKRGFRNEEKSEMFNAWWEIGMLAAESLPVMWLGFMGLAGGGASASAEAHKPCGRRFNILYSGS